MKKSTKKAVILGGIAAAGVAFWYFFFGPGASSASSPGQSSASSPAVLPWANPANAAEVDTITGWINSFPPASATSAQQWFKYMQTMGTQQDIDTMSTLILEYWGPNIAPSYTLDNYFTNLGNKVNSVTLP